MKKEETFNKYFKVFHDNFYNMILLKNDLVFYAQNSESLFKNLAKQFRLVPRIQGITFRMLIIYLYSILKESEDHSFSKVIKKHIKTFTNGKATSKHKDLISKIDELQSDRMYEVVKNLRNKHYAHLSFDRANFDVNLSIKELNEFIIKVEELFKDVYQLVKPGNTVSLLGLSTEIDMFAYKALDRYIKLDALYMSSKIENRNNVELIKLDNILRN